MKCRIDKRGKQVFTPNNERSKLFDKLQNIIGDFQKSLDIYSITETPEYKQYQESLKNTVGSTQLVSTEPLNTTNNEETRITELGEPGRDRRRWDPSRGNQTLEGAPVNTKRKNVTGADPELTYWAEEYAKRVGIDYKRQSKYVEVDVDRAMRIAEAYDAMEHAPQNPEVREAYSNLIQQTLAQYEILVEGGYQFYFFDETNDPYNGNPVAAMEELRNNKRMGSFATEAGFGTGNEGLDVSDNPMLEDTGLVWGWGSVDGEPKRVLANDLFRAVHDAFGHGLEGAGFRARGEENAWQAHARLFTGSAVAAITSETRGQNSWLNFGKYGEQNRSAKVEDTVFAPQKTGLMPEWTWQEGFDEGVESKEVKNSSVKTSISKSENPSFDSMLDFSTIGGVLEIGRIEGRDIYSILNLKVDESYRRQGVASKLLKEALNKTNGNLSGQASNDAAVELNYKLGMRAYKTEKELSLEESKTERAKSGGESIRMILPESMRGENYKPFATNTSEIEQIKSATENTGTFDNANPDIRFQIGYQNFQNNNLRSHMFQLYGNKIGSIRTKPVQGGEKVDSAIIYEAYRNQGLGTELYLETVRNLMIEGKKLYSDDSQTAPARRIWEKLVEEGLAIQTSENNFETIDAPSWMTPETTIDEVISNQPIDRSEPSLQELMNFINTTGEVNISKSEVIELMQANNLIDSQELKDKLALAEQQGIFIFTEQSLRKTGLFEKFEIYNILESKERQKNIKDTLKWLRTNEEFEIQPTELVRGGDLQKSGKIQFLNETGEFISTDLNDNIIKSNTRLNQTITFEFNETLSSNIAFLKQIVRETTWDNLATQIKDILGAIEVSGIDNGIDLSGLRETYHTQSRTDILNFLDSIENVLEGSVEVSEFESQRNLFLNFSDINNNKDLTPTERVIVENIPSDIAYSAMGLLRTSPNVYKRVPQLTYQELLEIEASKRGVDLETLNQEVNNNFDRSLEDTETAKALYLLRSNLRAGDVQPNPYTSQLDTFQGNFEYIVEQFPKDFGKWLIESKNDMFSMDWRGITLTNPNQSELALESVPSNLRDDLIEYSKLSKYLNFNVESEAVIGLDEVQVERDHVLNNPQNLPEYKGNYTELQNGEGILVRNGQGQFIKVNGVVFEEVDEQGNLVFYKPLPQVGSLMEIDIEKPTLISNVSDYTAYQTRAKETVNSNRKIKTTEYEC